MTHLNTLARVLLIGCCVATDDRVFAQWTWTPIQNIPYPTANHAICGATIAGDQNVYVFGGITSGLASEDIHLSCARYDVSSGQWSSLPDLPDTLGKIASAANVVGTIAYVIGGYHVFDGPPVELSSNKVHRLDLLSNTWLPDGAPIPVPIDDQVQAVWRDSLIYVITGWSNTTNVANVQVYDPALDSWSTATPVPNNNQYKAFGASGVIIGDTIHYYGGASTGFNFPALDRYRIGAINPSDPLEITWLPATSVPSGPRYRSAALCVDGSPCWLGGSSVSYNYDAIAYNGSGIVEPVTSIPIRIDGQWSDAGAAPFRIMDLRGVGVLDEQHFIVAGGIGLDRNVLDSAYLVTHSPVSVAEVVGMDLHGYPDPTSEIFNMTLPDHLSPCELEVVDPSGRTVMRKRQRSPILELPVADLPSGPYLLTIRSSDRIGVARLMIAHP